MGLLCGGTIATEVARYFAPLDGFMSTLHPFAICEASLLIIETDEEAALFLVPARLGTL